MKPTIRDNEAAIIDAQLRQAARSRNARSQRVILSKPQNTNRGGRVLFRPNPKSRGARREADPGLTIV
jgi:hypothetical protein